MVRHEWNTYTLGRYSEQPDETKLRVTAIIQGDHTGDSISFWKEGIATTTGYVLIDLSDIVNYPHIYVHHIGIDWIIMSGLASSTAVGCYDVGFITRINGTNCDWYSLIHGCFDKKEEKFDVALNFVPQSLVCLATKHISGGSMKFTNDATFKTGGTVEGVYGNPTPAVGDVVLKVTIAAGQGNLAVVIGYHSHEEE